MRLYRMKNKNGQFPWWVFADDLDEARELSRAAGRVRKAENANLIGDQTDFYQGTTDIEQVTVKGIAAIMHPGSRWHVGNPLTGERRDPSTGEGMPEGYTPPDTPKRHPSGIPAELAVLLSRPRPEPPEGEERKTVFPAAFGAPYGKGNS